MLGDDSPWILLADEADREVVLGLLWTPPAGGAKCAPADFEEFAAPGVAKVVWSLSVVPFGAGHMRPDQPKRARNRRTPSPPAASGSSGR